MAALQFTRAPNPSGSEELVGHSVTFVNSFSPVVNGPCLLAFGGFDGSNHHQLFAFDCGMHISIGDAAFALNGLIGGGKWIKVDSQETTPQARQFHSIVTCGGKLVLFGGKNNGYKNDLHLFDLGKSLHIMSNTMQTSRT